MVLTATGRSYFRSVKVALSVIIVWPPSCATGCTTCILPGLWERRCIWGLIHPASGVRGRFFPSFTAASQTLFGALFLYRSEWRPIGEEKHRAGLGHNLWGGKTAFPDLRLLGHIVAFFSHPFPDCWMVDFYTKNQMGSLENPVCSVHIATARISSLGHAGTLQKRPKPQAVELPWMLLWVYCCQLTFIKSVIACGSREQSGLKISKELGNGS